MTDTKTLLASEKFIFDYEPRSRHAVRVGIGFPNTYSVGMASLGYQLVWHMFRTQPGISVFRFFLPEKEAEPLTLEDGLSLRSMDILAFSVSFEMDYINLLSMLQRAGIPLFSKDRGEDAPLVLVGGPVSLINPAPLYGFADAVYIGDLETSYEEIASVFAQKHDTDRRGILEKLAGLEGMTVPALGKKGVRQTEHELDRYCCHSVICTPHAGFGDTLLFETARGCARGCRFCAAGNTTKPMRLRRPVLPDYASYGMVGAAVFDAPGSITLCREFVRKKAAFSLSSLRLETLDEEKLMLMKAGGILTVTVAPEAGTERLRNHIGKACPDDVILRAAGLTCEAGFGKMKLYFMTGLPGETDGDIIGTAELLQRLRRLYPRLKLSASAGIFVPKPGTPFGGEQQPPAKELERRLSLLKQKQPKGVDITYESPRLARVQWILAQADEKLGGAFLQKSLEGGYRAGLRYYDSVISEK
ncbi:MAG: radical SAM protein [Abditibacteriota bacterium]|nr:radical SAM protein [Abditibacteriota bacterium]